MYLVECIWINLARGMQIRAIWMHVCRLEPYSTHTRFLHSPGFVEMRLIFVSLDLASLMQLASLGVCVISELEHKLM